MPQAKASQQADLHSVDVIFQLILLKADVATHPASVESADDASLFQIIFVL